LQIRGTWSAGPGDDQARFLADLRALRDSAAIGYDELAARAHYPGDILKDAENGPYLPGLPILTAYVRACEGDVLDWEERWRRLNPELPEDPDLPVRPAGASAAAVAGARAGVGVAPPDVYDPERIRAALRGKARSDQAGRRASDNHLPVPAASATDMQSPAQDLSGHPGTNRDRWGANSSWDAVPDPGVTSANGNHSAKHGTRGPFDAALTSIPDAAEPAEPAPAEEFWPQETTPETRAAGSKLTWPEQTDNGRTAEPADSDFSWSGAAETESAAEPADVTARIPQYQADGVTSQERTDFWAKPTPPALADLRIPAAAPRAEEPTSTRASWSAPAEVATPSAAEPANRSATAAASAQPLSAAGSTAKAPVTDQDRRQDRLFPVRLLVVIVIAALIGSALVLLLK
jgi:hypothetical protein